MSISSTRVSSLPDGTSLSRYLMCLGASNGSSMTARILSERFIDTPQVKAVLELHTKAPAAAGSTSDATFAGPLAVHGVAREALSLIRGKSIVGQLESKFRRIPFRVKVARETGDGTGGAWIAEGNSTPVAATAYDTLSQEAYKCGKIVVLSRELLDLGNPSAELTVRQTVAAGVAAFVDTQFLTNTVTLSAGLRPAAVTNGATAVTSTGSSAAQISADLAGLLAAISTDAESLTWIMRPTTAATIAMRLAGAGTPTDLPRSLFGAPVIVSRNSPQQVTLLDAGHIFYSDEGGIELDVTEQASLQMDDSPSDPPVAGDTIINLFQANLWAVKCLRWLAYRRAQSGSVAYMVTAY